MAFINRANYYFNHFKSHNMNQFQLTLTIAVCFSIAVFIFSYLKPTSEDKKASLNIALIFAAIAFAGIFLIGYADDIYSVVADYDFDSEVFK